MPAPKVMALRDRRRSIWIREDRSGEIGKVNELTFLIHAARPQRQLEDDSTRSPRSKLRGNGRYSGDARCTPRPSCGGALAACPQPWDTVRRALGTLQSPRMLEASRWGRVMMANHCMLNTTTVSVNNHRGPHSTMSPRALVWGCAR